MAELFSGKSSIFAAPQPQRFEKSE